eukprot:Pgem_evm2s3990
MLGKSHSDPSKDDTFTNTLKGNDSDWSRENSQENAKDISNDDALSKDQVVILKAIDGIKPNSSGKKFIDIISDDDKESENVMTKHHNIMNFNQREHLSHKVSDPHQDPVSLPSDTSKTAAILYNNG